MFYIILIILLLVDGYLFSAIRSGAQLYKTTKFKSFYILTSIFSYVMLYMYLTSTATEYNDQADFLKNSNYIFGIASIFILVKFVGLIPILIDDIVRFIKWITLAKMRRYPQRLAFFSHCLVIQSAILISLMIYGVFWGRYDFKANTVVVELANLPKAFDGFRVVQFSDTHLGTFDHPEKVKRGIELIQQQDPDIIVFTGDLVNNFAFEAEPYIPMFAQLTSRYGKYAILGNHDYSPYAEWPIKSAKARNFKRLLATHDEMGFDLLNNRNELIHKDGQFIRLAGVENWGKPPFGQHGDINQALTSNSHAPVTILLTHDPSHWQAEVIKYNKGVDLTLSGHTHGMQFGFELGDWKWSPIQYFYEYWAGLYQHGEKYLYVNRGFGSNGYPGRVGMTPEITTIILRCKH